VGTLTCTIKAKVKARGRKWQHRDVEAVFCVVMQGVATDNIGDVRDETRLSTYRS
jgi:hypothetical protein